MDPRIMGLALLSYLLGGIPTGYLTVRWLRGIDIREYGSGNPGAGNVYRVAGPRPGLITLAVDALKGYLPVLLALRLFPEQAWAAMLCGACSIIGHDWTVFLGFRGGKGVATTAGVFAALMPAPTACAVGVFIAGFALTGHISVGSMSGALAFPLLCLLLKVPKPLVAFSSVAGILILYKHVPNIRRLLAKKELPAHEKK